MTTWEEGKGSLLDGTLKEKTIQSRDFFLSKVYFFFSFSLSSMFEEKLVLFPQTWLEVSKK